MVYHIIRADILRVASCVVFPSPAGASKNASNEQNVREYHMLNHLIRDLLFRYKKMLF